LLEKKIEFKFEFELLKILIIQKMENQNFIDIIGYEGLYQINKNGEILNIKRNKLLKGYINFRYRMVMLCKNGNKTNHLLHKLLATQFI
jgi:hypothetical protein